MLLLYNFVANVQQAINANGISIFGIVNARPGINANTVKGFQNERHTDKRLLRSNGNPFWHLETKRDILIHGRRNTSNLTWRFR